MSDWRESLSCALDLAGIKATQGQVHAVVWLIMDEVHSAQSEVKYLLEETERLREVLRQRNKMLPIYEEMSESLKQAVEWLGAHNNNIPRKPDHVCGPESNCTLSCEVFEMLEKDIHVMRALIARHEKESQSTAKER